MRRAARKDENQPAIVAALRGAGIGVEVMNQTGVPDLLIYMSDRIRLMEIKATGGAITKAQAEFRERWRGPPILTATNPHEAVAMAMEALR